MAKDLSFNLNIPSDPPPVRLNDQQVVTALKTEIAGLQKARAALDEAAAAMGAAKNDDQLGD